MVTDYDVWAESPVSTKEVIEKAHKSNEDLKKLNSGSTSTNTENQRLWLWLSTERCPNVICTID